ncbi:unnamed protein product [Spodoptera exigua]|nr:unnamed protein product [Spodoptera exigua]
MGQLNSLLHGRQRVIETTLVGYSFGTPKSVSFICPQKFAADLALAREFLKNKCYLHITVRQAWLLFLVGLEITMWFFLGETIGKRHIVGYSV